MAVRSIRNNNPGNIRISNTDWVGKVPGTDTSFETFQTPALGVRAMTKNLYSYQNRGLTSVRDMIYTWAPPSENDSAGYAERVANAMGVGLDDPVNLRGNPALTESMVSAMIHEEGGSEASSYFDSHVSSGVAMANGTVPPDADPTEDFEADPEDDVDTIDSADDAAQIRESDRRRAAALGRSFYEDNILNQYDSYTYSWAIHMVHPQTAQEFEVNLDRGTYITLAESGVENEISIENVIQSSVLAFERQNRNSVANIFDVTLLEAKGFTLLNRILLAAKELGIQNHTEACYLLELNFRGWHQGGRSTPEIIGPFYYMTTIVDFQIKHSDSATNYQVNFVETSQEAYNRLDFHFKSDITVKAGTFGNFLELFEKEINEETVKQTALTNSKMYANIYRFGVEPDAQEWLNWKFDAVIGQNVQESRNIGMTASGGLVEFVFKAGTSVNAAIAAALLQTREFKKIPIAGSSQFAKDSPEEGEAKPPKLAELIKWFSFTTNIAYKEFDPLSRQYQKEITYRVKSFLTPEGIHDPISFSELNQLEPLQRKRLNNILINGFLKKRFDYTYTGLNTEVLNLDLTFNNMYFALQPINGGAIIGQGGYFGGLTSDQEEAVNARNEFNLVKRRISRLNSENSRLENEALQNNSVIASALRDKIRQNTTNIERLQRQLDIKRNAIENLTSILTQQGGTVNTSLSPTAQKYITQSDVFASGRYNDSIAKSMNFDYRDVRDSLAASGADTMDDIGTAMLGALELNLNSTGEMVEQRLEIRGDPYWLGRPKGASQSNSNQADYTTGGVGYFLNLRFPVYEDSNGLMDQELTNFSITALYRVTKVTSMYMAGEFKQTLESFRDTNTNVPMLMEQLMDGKVR